MIHLHTFYHASSPFFRLLNPSVGRKKMAYKWLCKLKKYYPHLALRAEALNRRDSFKMKYNPEEAQELESFTRKASL